MMSDTFRRTGPKIGRNDPCFCGSGRKFKHCHGRPQYALPNLIANADFEHQIIAEGKRQLERHKVRELQRQKQQGWGRPIISVEHKGYRFVAVGNRLHYGKWKTFYDFLNNYIKATIGSDWGNAEIAKPIEERHPIMQWYDKLCHLQMTHAGKPGELFSTPMTGAVSAYNRLAYNLYLIAHNGKDIQTRLLDRLKNKDNFQGAYYETQVAAWLIKAGFELEFENEQDKSSSHCEFTATYMPTGEKYSVEAKARERREGGSARTPVGHQLRKALVKNANHKRLVFIDLNKALHTQEAAFRAMDRAELILNQSEKDMQIDGVPAPSAYVCITNMNDQHALDSTSIGTLILFVGFKLPDFMGEYKSPREAVHARERHLPMFRLLKSMEEHNEIPQTFGGELPSEAFSAKAMPRLKIGQLYLVPGPDGVEVPAELMQAIVMDKKACAVLRDPKTNKNWIGTFGMTSEELADYARYPETYFGVYQKQSKGIRTIMDMYDFFADAYENTPKDKLIALLQNYPDQDKLRHLSQKELVEIVAERYTYGVMSHGFVPKTREEMRSERRGNGREPAQAAEEPSAHGTGSGNS
ncbi:MAG: SEC-C domain-containing protein [Pseudomonadota bacterium]|nr:SEC-C domain-containing protein [Pseudomonadota bacterium]